MICKVAYVKLLNTYNRLWLFALMYIINNTTKELLLLTLLKWYLYSSSENTNTLIAPV